jgi:hypothetical protein
MALRGLVEKRSYLAALVVTFVVVPGTAGFLTSTLYLLHEMADMTCEINDGGPKSFLYGSAIALGLWPVSSLLFQRYGRVEESNPIEYARLRDLCQLLRVRHASRPAQLAETALDNAEKALRLVGEDVSTRGILWASQGGYVVVRANLELAEREMIEFEPEPRLDAVREELRSRIDGSRIPGSAALIETLQDAKTELDKASPDLVVVRTKLAQVKQAVDEFRDGRRFGLVAARSNLYGAIVLGGTLAYFVLGLALVAGAGGEQILAGIVFYLIGAVIGLFRQLLDASSADTKIEEDYGLDDARLIQRPLFSGVAAVGGVVLTTVAVVLAPTPSPAPPTTTTNGAGGGGTATAAAATTVGAPAPAPEPSAGPTTTTPSEPSESGGQQDGGTDEAQAEDAPSLEEIFDLHRNPLSVLYAAIFGLTPALLAARLKGAAERFKSDLRSTEPAEQAGPG